MDSSNSIHPTQECIIMFPCSTSEVLAVLRKSPSLPGPLAFSTLASALSLVAKYIGPLLLFLNLRSLPLIWHCKVIFRWRIQSLTVLASESFAQSRMEAHAVPSVMPEHRIQATRSPDSGKGKMGRIDYTHRPKSTRTNHHVSNMGQ
jgi:hypothetical protein